MPLPELMQGFLGGARVEEYFADLERWAEVLEVVVRRVAGERVAGGGGVTLPQARELLACGGASGLQVRYLHAGDEWVDTLLCREDGVRIVRMKVPSGGVGDG